MANLKAIISKNVGTTLTSAYTNTSGADAALKAFNVNHVGNATEIASVTASGNSYGFLGNSNIFMSKAAGYCLPNIIKLSDNKLLLLTNMTYLYEAVSSSRVEAQIVEWDGSKYINYPTTELNISTAFFSTSGIQGFGLYGVALTASKVAFVSNGNLYVITITNNVVDATVQSVAASAFYSTGIKIQPVPGNTDKVILFNANAGITSFVAQAYNVPTGSTPTTAGSLFTVMATPVNGARDFCLHRRTDPTYFFAGFTSSTAVSGTIATFTDATNTWTSTSSTSTIVSSGVSSTNNPLVTIPLSTDGSSSYNTIVVIGNSSSNFDTYPQTSGTSVSSVVGTSIGANSNTANSSYPIAYYNLGSRKAIITGCNWVHGINDSGTSTSLLGAGAAEDCSNIPLTLPFSSRPLYFYNTSGASYANLMGRTGLTDTTFGTYSDTGNFIQFGTPNGKAYAWSDTANCWFAIQGETLYALDINGNILAERKLNISSSTTSKHTAKVISIAPDGRIGVLSDGYGIATDGFSNIDGTIQTSTTFCRFILFQTSTGTGITSSTQLSSGTSSVTTFNTASQQPRKAADLILFNNSSGTLSFICCGLGWSTTAYFFWHVATVAAPNTSVTGQSSNFAVNITPDALYTNGNLILTTPTVSGSYDPYVRYVGSLMNSASSKTGYLNYTTTPASTSSIGAISTFTSLSTNSNDRYVPAVSRTQTGMSAILAPSGSANNLYLWTSYNNSSVNSAYTISSMTNSLKPEVITSQNLTLICNGASGSAAITPFFQFWGNTSTSPYASGTATSTSRSTFNISKSPDKYSLSINGNGVNSTYISAGAVATTFNLTINDGTNDFYAVNAASIAVGSQYRAADVYYVPNGYSVKIQAGAPRQMDAMLEVLEQ